MPVEIGLVSKMTDDQQQALLAAHGDQIRLHDFSQNRDGLAAAGDLIDVVYGNVRPFELPAMTRLRWVQATWTGIENLMYPAMVDSDVIVTCTKGPHARQIAEHALTGVLYLARDFAAHERAQHAKSWQRDAQPLLLSESTAMVMGLGSIGGTICHKLRTLGLHVLGVSRSGRQNLHCDHVYDTSHFHSALGQVDFLVLALPQTPDTDGLIDAAVMAALKPGAGIVNIGRGNCVDESALVAAIESGQLRGAVLDVTHPEPPSEDSPLWTTPGVLLTGHRSWGAGAAVDSLTGFAVFQRNLPHYLAGEAGAMECLVDKSRGY